MSKKADCAKLQTLADLSADHHLMALRKAALQRDDTKRKIAALNTTFPVLGEGGVAGALTALNYQRWAEARQIELRHVLAQQTAIWLDAQQAAMLSFGKARSLEGMRAKLPS